MRSGARVRQSHLRQNGAGGIVIAGAAMTVRRIGAETDIGDDLKRGKRRAQHADRARNDTVVIVCRGDGFDRRNTENQHGALTALAQMLKIEAF